MKQTVNLLPPKPKKVRNGLSFYNLLYVVALIIVLSTAASSYFWWQTQSFNNLETLQRIENNTLQNQVIELSDVVAKRKLPSNRENIVFELQQEIDAMQQMTAITDEFSSKNLTGYLSIIRGLEKHLPKNTTLENYQLYNDGKLAYIKGSTHNPVAIPQYIELLRNRGFLRNQNIASIRSLRGTENYAFELTFVKEENE